jgi:tetratricopeptide (TPR) repeat protein
LTTRAIRVQPTASVYFQNLVWAQLSQGKVREAQQTVASAVASIPRSASIVLSGGVAVALAEGRLNDAIRMTDSVRANQSGDADVQRQALNQLAAYASAQGRLADASRYRAGSRDAGTQLGASDDPLTAALAEALTDAWFRGDTARARRRLEQALAEHPLGALPAALRPYGQLSMLYALLGRPDGARAMQAGHDSTRAGTDPQFFASQQQAIRGDVAWAEGRYEEAARELGQASTFGFCPSCLRPRIAHAYDLAGETDSALVYLRGYTESTARIPDVDAFQLASAHKRLGELYEAKGDRANARAHYARFVALWESADPELQPQVRQARERLAALERAER